MIQSVGVLCHPETAMTTPKLPENFPHPYGLLPPKVLAYESTYHPPTGGFKTPEGTFSYGPVEVEVGRLWYSLVMLHRPQYVLETGTHQGFSTACIAAALRLLGGAIYATRQLRQSGANPELTLETLVLHARKLVPGGSR